MDKQALINLFEEIIAAWKSAEKQNIHEHSSNFKKDYGELDKEEMNYRQRVKSLLGEE